MNVQSVPQCEMACAKCMHTIKDQVYSTSEKIWFQIERKDEETIWRKTIG